MNLIVAVDNEWNIGYKNDLLFHLPDDMKFFRKTTLNKVVVMGRKTLESFPNSKPLKDRVNIVLSRDTAKNADGAIFVNGVDALLEQLKEYDSENIFVIGGEMIYSLLLPYCDTAYVTHIDTVAEIADKKFPELTADEWKITWQSEENENNGLKFKFTEYKRIDKNV